MTNHETDTTAVLERLKSSLGDVTMHRPVGPIVSEARARRRRRRLAGGATGVAAVTALALGVPALNHTSSPSAGTALGTGAGSVHIRTVAYSLDTHADGTIHVTWDKEQYFENRTGLAKALHDAGFPVVIKEGQFCVGPNDDASLSPGGVGPGVDQVMRGESSGDGEVNLVFSPAEMPAGKQLFIGYLSPAQLAVTHGRPGSVERLVSATDPLTCTTTAPPPGPPRHDGGSGEGNGGSKDGGKDGVTGAPVDKASQSSKTS